MKLYGILSKSGMKEVEAILLAGGRGRRMGELTLETQKCLLPIDGKPVLGYVLDSLLLAFGSVDLKIAVNYKAGEVKKFVDNYKSAKISVKYVPHEDGVDSWGAYFSMKNEVSSPFIGLPGDVITEPRVYEDALINYYSRSVDLIMSLSPKIDKVDTHA